MMTTGLFSSVALPYAINPVKFTFPSPYLTNECLIDAPGHEGGSTASFAPPGLTALPRADPLAWPGPGDLARMVLVGMLSGLGQYLLIKAYQRVSASSLAPFNYFHLLLAVVFSVLVFGQRPDALALLGIAVIACAGLVLTLPVFRTQLAAILESRQTRR